MSWKAAGTVAGPPLLVKATALRPRNPLPLTRTTVPGTPLDGSIDVTLGVARPKISSEMVASSPRALLAVSRPADPSTGMPIGTVTASSSSE